MVPDRTISKSGGVIANFNDGNPMARKLVRNGKKVLIVASNRNYPPISFDNEKGAVKGAWHAILPL